MAPSLTETVTAPLQSLSLQGESAAAQQASASTSTSSSATPAPAPAPAPSSTSGNAFGNAPPGQAAWDNSAFAGYDDPDYKYSRFLPAFDHSLHLPPLEPFEHADPGHAALSDPKPRSFLEGAVEDEMTPDFGSEVTGVQLRDLDERGRQQLALFVAQRGVVAFRDQRSFIDADPEWQLNDWGRGWGRLHIHPTSGQPAEYPELHLVYRDGKRVFNLETNERLTTSVWHSDVSGLI